MVEELKQKAVELSKNAAAMMATIGLFDAMHDRLVDEAEKSGEIGQKFRAYLAKLAWLEVKKEKLNELEKIAKDLKEVEEQIKAVDDVEGIDWNEKLKDLPK